MAKSRKQLEKQIASLAESCRKLGEKLYSQEEKLSVLREELRKLDRKKQPVYTPGPTFCSTIRVNQRRGGRSSESW